MKESEIYTFAACAVIDVLRKDGGVSSDHLCDILYELLSNRHWAQVNEEKEVEREQNYLNEKHNQDGGCDA